MVLESTTENQICSPFHLSKPYLLCVSILVPSLIVLITSFLGLGFYVSLFTTTILMILSTSFLVIKFSKKRKVVELEDEVLEEADNGIVNEFQVVEPLDLTSESGISEDSGSSINLEMNWMISGNNMEQNPEISDEYSTSEDDDDDDEGLIEIAIPSNDSTCLSEEPKENLQFNLPAFLPESIFQQQDLVELLAKINEVNEEENLIEIDISMGSIKCPTFKIEA